MTVIDLAAAGSLGAEPADALIVGVYPGPTFSGAASWVREQLGDSIDGHLAAIDFEGKGGQVAVVPADGEAYGSVVFVGLGDDPDAEALRQAAGTAGRTARRFVRVATTLHLEDVDGAAGAVVGGFVLGQYSFDRHRSTPKPALTETLLLIDAGDAAIEAGHRALAVAGGVNLARDLVNESAVNKPPAVMADIAVGIGDDTTHAVCKKLVGRPGDRAVDRFARPGRGHTEAACVLIGSSPCVSLEIVGRLADL